jgi:hypothetical protein
MIIIEVVLLVVTLAIPQHTTRAVSADWPFFRTMGECRAVLVHMENAPPIADRIECERHQLDISTGRIVR